MNNSEKSVDQFRDLKRLLAAMMRLVPKIDFVIRIVTVSVVVLLGLPWFFIICVMVSGSGTQEAYAASIKLLGVGVLISGAVCFLALFPDKVSTRMPGPKIIWDLLLRIPVYAFGPIGFFLYFYYSLVFG